MLKTKKKVINLKLKKEKTKKFCFSTKPNHPKNKYSMNSSTKLPPCNPRYDYIKRDTHGISEGAGRQIVIQIPKLNSWPSRAICSV